MPSKTKEKLSKSKISASPQPSPVGRGRSEATGEAKGWPGSKSVQLFDEEQKYIGPGNQSIALSSKLAIEKGQGCYITDADGNSYLDFNVGVSVASLGYSHPKYVKALTEQLSKVTVGSYTSRARLGLVKLISQIA